MDKELCRDCACLVEDENKKWACDEAQKPISEVIHCPEGLDRQYTSTKKEITIEMLRLGYDLGIVESICSPNADGVACGIGEHWFYFDSAGYDYMDPEQYITSLGKEHFVEKVFDALNDMLNDEDTFKDEYEYYVSYLNEEIPRKTESKYIRDLCYKLYKLDWIHTHQITKERQADALKNFYEEHLLIEEPDHDLTFDDYLMNVGYDGECFCCFDEFLDSEYREQGFIYGLLDNSTLQSIYDNDLQHIDICDEWI